MRALLLLCLVPLMSSARPSHRDLGDMRSAQDRQDRRDAKNERRRAKAATQFDREERGEDACTRGERDCTCPVGTTGPGSLTSDRPCFPAFRGDVVPLTPELQTQMRGKSWHDGCPPLDGFSLVTVTHWDENGRRRTGKLIVSSGVADDVRSVFEKLYEARFPVSRLEPVDAFGGDDDASMAANNTSAFNCRSVAGETRLSRHAEGEALDLNPLWNPMIKRGVVSPPEGRAYADRHVRPGLVVEGGPAVRAFESIGWKWGGKWRSLKDYQHFSKAGD